MSDYRADLDALRTAAQGRDWTPLQDTLKRLLARLEPLPALEVPATQIQAFLPRFETYYPDAGWVRQLALTVISYGSAPKDLPEQAVNQFPSPGCGNFVRGVLDLGRAVQDQYSIFERYSHATNATANTVLADLMDFYYHDHLDEWAHVNEPDTVPDVRQRLYARFWLNEAVAARDTATWLAIADLLDQRLRDLG